MSYSASDHRDTANQPSREWWAQRWVDVLESFGWRRRLERARNYARQGNVLSVEYRGAKVVAKVQGTAPEPYNVSLSLEPFSDEQWGYVIETLAERAIFSAKLLAGEMPQTIEEVFTANGLSLFPFTKFDIRSKCSCPDPANPCKHIGALYYVLGDRFSEDPFVLFQLRGRTKEQIITTLRQLRSSNDTSELAKATEPSRTPQRPATPIKLERFWQYDDPLELSLVVIAPPPTDETVLDVLGTLPLRAEPTPAGSTPTSTATSVMEYLGNLYKEVSQQAVLSAMISDG